MAIIQFQIPEENISLKELANAVAIIMKELQWAINGNLDVKNIRANSIEAKNIKAGTITADLLNVTELSAITANMGTITAGSLITNAEINVGTDATVGDNLTVGDAFSGANSVIFLNFASLAAAYGADSLEILAPGPISILSSGDDILLSTFGTHRVSINAPGGFWVNGNLVAP